MAITLNPYLNFDKTTHEAMKFYHSIFGGKLDIQTFVDSGIPNVPEGEKDLVVHARLEFDGNVIMSSDGGKDHPVHMGDNVHMSLQGEDNETLTKWFDQLAEGGSIEMPMAKQFWGDVYGQLTDKFGVHWMINILSKKD